MKNLIILLVILLFISCEEDVCMKCIDITAPVGQQALYPNPHYLYYCTFSTEIICDDFTYKEIKEMEDTVITYNAEGTKVTTFCIEIE